MFSESATTGALHSLLRELRRCILLNISERYAAQCIEVVDLFFQRVFEAVVTFFRCRIREGSETAIEIVVVLVGIEGHFQALRFFRV